VHRPAYLDYVGVKTFDANGEVDGERRFLGLLASAAYTESLMRIPLIRDRAAAVLKRSGFDPRSHAGKALRDTLETYPRDELLHTPVDELAPMAEAAMSARERRQVRMFIRRDTYGRYVSVLVYLPRDRYNTGVRERFERILQDQLHGESIEFTVRINESTTARVHFVVHLQKGDKIPDVDTADLERRLTEASRSWRDDFTQAVIAEYGEEVGTLLGRRYVDLFPEAYKEDISARTAGVDLGRLEAIRTDGPDGSGLDLSLYERLDAGPGEAQPLDAEDEQRRPDRAEAERPGAAERLAENQHREQELQRRRDILEEAERRIRQPFRRRGEQEKRDGGQRVSTVVNEVREERH
jgi:glutamate dehydrogenase